jgi:hypothetical protein
MDMFMDNKSNGRFENIDIELDPCGDIDDVI